MRKLLLGFLIGFLFTQSDQSKAIEVAFERDSGLPLVFISIAVKTGAVTDPPSKSGITRFMGQMLLRGTKSRTKEQIDRSLDQLGATLEVETRAEALILRGAVLASRFHDFMAIVHDVITQPSFPRSEIRKLKSETISGILQSLGRDRGIARQLFEHHLFKGHPYGKFIMGTQKSVQGFTRTDIIAQYEKLVRDRNLLVVGSGDTDPKNDVAKWAKRIGGDRPGGSPGLRRIPSPRLVNRELLIFDKPDRTQTQIYVGQIGTHMTDPNFFPLYVGNHAFGGPSFQARMIKQIRVERGWSYVAYSYFRHGTQPRLWTFTFFPAAKYTPTALAYSLEMVRKLRKKGITEEEFQFAKNSLINNAGFRYDTPNKRVENVLLEKTLDLPAGFMRSFGERISSVKREQVNQALKEFLKPESFLITVLGTAKDLKGPIAKLTQTPEEAVRVIPYSEALK